MVAYAGIYKFSHTPPVFFDQRGWLRVIKEMLSTKASISLNSRNTLNSLNSLREFKEFKEFREFKEVSV
jgi:hypothetical protein